MSGLSLRIQGDRPLRLTTISQHCLRLRLELRCALLLSCLHVRAGHIDGVIGEGKVTGLTINHRVAGTSGYSGSVDVTVRSVAASTVTTARPSNSHDVNSHGDSHTNAIRLDFDGIGLIQQAGTVET